MGKVNEVDNKFTWVIKNFSALQCETIYSDEFVIGGCKWRLCAYPIGEGNSINYFSLYLDVADYKSLPPGWKRRAKFSFKIVNQFLEKFSLLQVGSPRWFDQKATGRGFPYMTLRAILHEKDGGFVVNGEVKIVAEVEVLEVIGKLDVPEESEETTKPLSIDVNGFQVLPTQEESVRRIFERHPDIAVEFRGKNQLLRKACINFLLSLIEMLCQPLEELTNEDLVEADFALTYLEDANFKVDWLEKKLTQVKEKKEKEVSELARLQETEENLMKLKLKCSELDVLAEEQKAELSATRTPMSFDDVV